MRYRLFLMSLLLVPFVARAQVSPYKQIDFNWRYTPNLPVCGATLVACFAGFSMTDLISGHVVATLPTSLRSWNYIPGGGVQYGKHTFNLVAEGYDGSGNLVKSAAAVVVVDVFPPPSTPSGLTGVLQ